MFHRANPFIFALLLTFPGRGMAMNVETNFAGASIAIVGLDEEQQVLTFTPTPHKDKGWNCWWSFRLTGVNTNLPISLTVLSTSAFGRPTRAMFSHDGVHWQHTEPGRRLGSSQLYRHVSVSNTIHFAWGPPFQLRHADELVADVLRRDPAARSFQLCRTREENPVPALRWEPPRREGVKRHGIWIEARQHAWESGSSWVCRGLLEWLTSADPAAQRLKQDTRIVVVPIMDVDNVERGAGGKDQIPHDHNRDWSDRPVWPAVAAAQQQILALDREGEFDLFLDLHNPSPGDQTPFFFGPPETHLPDARKANQQRFHAAALKELGAEALGLSSRIRISGPGYHPLWRQISKNWVAEHTAPQVVALTLETSWNTPNSTPDGYLAYGRALGRTIAAYLLEQ